MSTTNGHVVDQFRSTYAAHEQRQRDTITEMISELELAIAAEADGRLELDELITASKEREAHMRKALGALSGKPPSHAGRTERPAAPQGKAGWTPSEERITWVHDQLRAWLATEPEGDHTKTALSKWINERASEEGEVGVAHDTVSKCLDILRERELVRVTGKTRGGGKTWALMPGATHAA